MVITLIRDKIMTQEDKELLLKDLCARLPYNAHIFTNSKHHIRLLTISRDLDYDEQYWINGLYDIDEVKPYLRPMSSMTEEEREKLEHLSDEYFGKALDKQIQESLSSSNRNESRILEYIASSVIVDWLNTHHFDYRGLIEKGLAIEVTEENNPYEN